jgi:hypothetical protein
VTVGEDLFPFIAKRLEVRSGDTLVLESSTPLTPQIHEGLRRMFDAAKRTGAVPPDVFVLVMDRDLDVRKMGERERRMLLDQLCAAMKLRTVPA